MLFVCVFVRVCARVCVCACVCLLTRGFSLDVWCIFFVYLSWYGAATISSLLKIAGLFCIRTL